MTLPVHHSVRRSIGISAIVATLAACGGGGDNYPGPSAEPQGMADEVEDGREHALAVSPLAEHVLSSDRLVVEMVPGANADAFAIKHGGKVVDRLGQRPIYLMMVSNPDVTITNSNPAQNPEIVAIGRNRPVRSLEHQAGSIKNSVIAIGKMGDTVTGPWAESALSLPTLNRMAVPRGAGVTVGVLDTGVMRSHEALSGRVVPGWDFISNDNNPEDVKPFPEFKKVHGLDWAWGHGTHVAGVIAKVAPDASIMPVRVLDNTGRGSVWTVAKGVVWAINPNDDLQTGNGADVLNMSLGTDEPSFLLERVVQIAGCSPQFLLRYGSSTNLGFQKDIARCSTKSAVVVAGAGNKRTARLFPAAYDNVPSLFWPYMPDRFKGLRSVTASTMGNNLWIDASLDPSVDIAAPGELITSAFADGGYATMTGTSMATPWVSGTAAMVISSNRLLLRKCNEGVLKYITYPGRTTHLYGPTGVRQIAPLLSATQLSREPFNCS